MPNWQENMERIFRASAHDEPIELSVDGEGPTVVAPYFEEWNGFGYAWLTREQFPAVNADMAPEYKIWEYEDGSVALADPGGVTTLIEENGRFPVGPWRWQYPGQYEDRG